MTRYSVAIRTLALNQELLFQELESIKQQTIKAEKTVVYIARGYEVPVHRVGDEMYVITDKGMLTQRAVDYKEIDTPLIMLLDDDIILEPDSAEKMITALHNGNYSCIGADVFENHKMSVKNKLYAAFSNLTFPHADIKFAIKIRGNGSFSYIIHPASKTMETQSAAGPCSIWRKSDILRIDASEEKWIDSMGFPYNEDTLLFYKLYRNGGKIGLLFDSGVTHCNGRTASQSYHKDTNRFSIRVKVQFILWHRMIYLPSESMNKRVSHAVQFCLKSLCMIPAHLIAAILYRDITIPLSFIIGLYQGFTFTRTFKYKSLRPYVSYQSQ